MREHATAVSFGPRGGKKPPLKTRVKFSQALHFAGNKTPMPSDVNLELSTMFAPLNSNYPAVDLLIWDANEKHLFAIQVTIREKVSDHMKEIAGAERDLEDVLRRVDGGSDFGVGQRRARRVQGRMGGAPQRHCGSISVSDQVQAAPAFVG
jgi:hypothetical protein